MSGVISLSGQILGGPPISGDPGTFPSGTTNIPLSLRDGPGTVKTATVETGLQVRPSFNSPSAYAVLGGVGATDTVTKGTFVYLKTKGAMLLRLTTYDSGGDVVAVLPIDGAFVHEFDASKYLKLIELKGSGSVEWFASGAE